MNRTWRRLTRRERVAAALTSVLLVGALLYARLLEPTAGRWLDVHGQAQSRVRELARLESLVRHRAAIEDACRKTSGAVASGASDEALLLDLMKGVERSANASGLEVKSVKPARAQRPAMALRRCSVQISVDGEPNQLLAFLHVLQRPEQSLCADALTVSVRRTRPSVNATLVISNLARIVEGDAREPR